jgi:hypothetical protein
LLPAFTILLGIGALASFWVGGDATQGWVSFGVLAGLGVAIGVGGRSETIRGLRGDGRDEYWQSLDLNATALAGMAVILAVVGMSMWEWAHGRDGSPYSQLGAVAGVSYLGALLLLRWRR